MPRVAGVDIPNDKPTVIALTYIYGIGRALAADICRKIEVDPNQRAKNLSDEELSKIANLLESECVTEGRLRRQVQQNISRLREIRSYRGDRHRAGLPTRGQRTRCNARTRKGKKRTVAGKKGVKG